METNNNWRHAEKHWSTGPCVSKYHLKLLSLKSYENTSAHSVLTNVDSRLLCGTRANLCIASIWGIYSCSIHKVKAIPVTRHRGLYGSETSRLPHFLDNQLTDDVEVVRLTLRPPLCLGRFLVPISEEYVASILMVEK
jgi:hypothetical protein